MNLYDLPSDVIRKIFKVGYETVDTGTRLISRRWNSFALEHLSNRNNLPVLDSFWWRKYNDLPNVYMTFSHRYKGYFGSRGSLARKICNVSSSNYTLHIRSGLTCDGDKNESGGRVLWDHTKIIFKRCSRIGKLQWDIGSSGTDTFEIIKDVMRDLIVDELNLAEFDELENIIPLIYDIIERNKIGRILFISRGFYAIDQKGVEALISLIQCIPDKSPTIGLILHDITPNTEGWARDKCEKFKDILDGTGQVKAVIIEEKLTNGVRMGMSVMKRNE